MRVRVRASAPARSRDLLRESDLYSPVKAFLEAQGYTVKGEVRGCDVVGTRGAEPPVIVELKRAFGLALVLQGVDRLSLTDRVYLAVAAPASGRTRGTAVQRRDVRNLCRRLGLGLLTVTPGSLAGAVHVVLDPLPYRPRRRTRRLAQLLGEHARRHGDPTRGGVSRTPVLTAYRQEALRCAHLLDTGGPTPLRALRETGVVPNAARILQRDVYGWFERTGRGIYGLTARGRRDLQRFSAVSSPAPASGPPPAAARSPGTAVAGEPPRP